MAIAFAVVFMAQIEKQLLTSYKPHKPFLWKIYIDDIFCVWTIPETESTTSIIFVTHCTHEISSAKIVFLDTEVFTGPRFTDSKILDF